ncbi:ribonucleoside-diphosphate reductase subunit alpha [Helicobacter trogontum]|uniref:Ribonucleoside-diphosphate reductase n=2 Tax=Helicobacter trogontum TaxID=50960 RepID=A0A4U8TGS5_9HELI|nr:ribonucleoside-diphosphate reductase subunit alpha [Helicobacter trogontum]MDY5185435.1 ribonucleoside-diphosphate reductase subunit alpha [Helicobacter trogontum]TLD99366.1 ribonucleoside-diphosphate reductase subunit alpha [Helicobacter trogontum]
MQTKYVTKRNGSTEELDITKIQKHTSSAVEGLSGTSQSELEVDAKLQFYDGITTEKIQETLIKTAVDKIDVASPNWTFVAARLFLYDLYHRVSRFTGYRHLRDYFEVGEREGKLLKGLKEKFDLDLLNSKIVTDRDLQFNYLGIKTLYDRYLLKDSNGKPIELPQHMFMAIAMFLAQNEDDCNAWAIKFYDALSNFEVMCATPTLSNARTTRHQLSSCYIGSTPDNIEGIFDSYKEMALLSKYGGGIGWDFSQVRTIGSFIDGHKNAAGGIIPFLKITNDIAIAVDQLGTRKGAIATYIEIWHNDVPEFIELRKNSGEERRRTHDLFPALWVCDLFMERVLADAQWSFFDPYACRELTNLYGDEFKKRYEELERTPNMVVSSMPAKDLWKKILNSYFETGLPFLCFKDSANKANPNAHSGIIRSSNLCTEIFQNTEPSHYQVEVEFNDGEKIYLEERDEVCVDSGVTKRANKLTSIDSVNGKKIFNTQRVQTGGQTAVCNLASINLSKIHTHADIERIVPIAVRMLDNVIDLNFYPSRKVKVTNMANRAIGLGVMGEAELLASKLISWGSEAHFNLIDGIMEAISYNAIKASSMLATERGAYPTYEGSNWSKGIFPIDKANEKAKQIIERSFYYDWDSLRALVKNQGMRNGYLMAIAPTSSISILVGTTQTIEPIYKQIWHEENLSGMIKSVVPNLTLETMNYYSSAYSLNQHDLVRAAAIRQKWIDQGQSLNIFIRLDSVSGKQLHEIYMFAWSLGLKSTYYLRSQSKETDDVVNRDMECVGCQ